MVCHQQTQSSERKSFSPFLLCLFGSYKKICLRFACFRTFHNFYHCRWLSRELLLDMIEKNALRSLEQEIRIAATTEHPINLPDEPSLHAYFASIRYEGRKHIFGNIKKTGAKEKSKRKENQPIQSHLDAAACRLLYRLVFSFNAFCLTL